MSLLRVISNGFLKINSTMDRYSIIEFQNCSCDHYFHGPNFPNTETIVLLDCTQNFIKEWIKPDYFPDVKEIYTSQPFDKNGDWFSVFKNKEVNIFMFEQCNDYYKSVINKVPINFKITIIKPFQLFSYIDSIELVGEFELIKETIEIDSIEKPVSNLKCKHKSKKQRRLEKRNKIE